MNAPTIAMCAIIAGGFYAFCTREGHKLMAWPFGDGFEAINAITYCAACTLFGVIAEWLIQLLF